MKFWKYHGLGNDFIIIDNWDGSVSLSVGDVTAMCHRRFGIGADGVILIEKSSIADVRMRIINSDGSKAEMCGNGIRCFAKYVFDHSIVRSSNIAVETDAGIKHVGVKLEGSMVSSAVVNMGKPDFAAEQFSCTGTASELISIPITVEGKTFYAACLWMGVPHTVIFTESLEDESIIRFGKLIERHPMFPQGTNVNFVKVVSRDEIIIRTWERGAGYTYACGTGSCASVAAGVLQDKVNQRVKVRLRGGDLIIEWRDKNDIYMEGPAVEVYEGFFHNS